MKNNTATETLSGVWSAARAELGLKRLLTVLVSVALMLATCLVAITLRMWDVALLLATIAPAVLYESFSRFLPARFDWNRLPPLAALLVQFAVGSLFVLVLVVAFPAARNRIIIPILLVGEAAAIAIRFRYRHLFTRGRPGSRST